MLPFKSVYVSGYWLLNHFAELAVSFEISLANVVAREDEGVIGVKFVLREGTVFEAFNISFALESGTATGMPT